MACCYTARLQGEEVRSPSRCNGQVGTKRKWETLKSLLMALALLALLVAPAAASHGLNCDNFESQADAQDYLREDPSDPEGLDGPIGPTGAGIEGVACDAFIGEYEDPETDLVPVTQGTTPTPAPTEPPAPVTATPEATAVATAGPGPLPTEGKPDTRQDEDGQTEDDQSEDMPEEMPETGVGGLATGLPVGSIAGGVSLLLLSGYALLRRR